MANSGGGAIVVGVRDDGAPATSDLRGLLTLDPAKVTDKVFAYTGEQFAAFQIEEGERFSAPVAMVAVGAVDLPLVFSKPGTYEVGGAKRSAFAQGTVYVRHGAKSEPGTTADLGRFIERRLESVRRRWLSGIRRVVAAPEDAQVAIYQTAAVDEAGRPARVRFTDDPSAPLFGRLSIDDTHPYRQKELIVKLNSVLPNGLSVNTHDMQCVRSVLEMTPLSHPRFLERPKYGSTQYSDEFVDWLVEQARGDPMFFQKLRTQYAAHEPHVSRAEGG